MCPASLTEATQHEPPLWHATAQWFSKINEVDVHFIPDQQKGLSVQWH